MAKLDHSPRFAFVPAGRTEEVLRRLAQLALWATKVEVNTFWTAKHGGFPFQKWVFFNSKFVAQKENILNSKVANDLK